MPGREPPATPCTHGARGEAHAQAAGTCDGSTRNILSITPSPSCAARAPAALRGLVRIHSRAAIVARNEGDDMTKTALAPPLPLPLVYLQASP